MIRQSGANTKFGPETDPDRRQIGFKILITYIYRFLAALMKSLAFVDLHCDYRQLEVYVNQYEPKHNIQYTGAFIF